MSKKILLIEDHREIRHLTGKCLRHLGYDLVEAEHGQLGVRMALAENRISITRFVPYRS